MKAGQTCRKKGKRRMTGITKNEENGTYNLIVDGEWIYEGTYEQCESMWYNCLEAEEEEWL